MEDEELDEEALLEQAKLLSMEADAQMEANKAGDAGLNLETDFGSLLDNDFVGEIIKDLGVDINPDDILGDKKGDKKDEKKKD
jgi:hypothetical protein